ncbi:MAG: HAD family hydrolase [Synergistaceae bacterium]|nr:HAD family hydrolase [Synergistaceae bacterium]
MLEGKQNWIEKKIAILGGSTTANIKQSLDLFLLNQGIKAEFYESGYGKFYEDAIFSTPELNEFKPDIVYIHTSNRNIQNYPELTDSPETINTLVQAEIEKYKSVWESIFNRFNCPIIQNNFEMPLYRLLGNKDASDPHGAVNFLTRLNMAFYDYAQRHNNFFICDINYISADYGLKEWSNPFYWYMYKYALCVDAIPYLAFNVANIIKSLLGKNKKGLVLDLDNTLWGGVIGDDGVENIKIGKEESTGQVYSEFQSYLKSLKQLGLVLCVDSKNEEANALAGLNHPEGILKPDDMLIIKANWEPKDKNMADIANELSLLPESLVFIDDNPAERHIVSEQLKGVSAPEIGESHQYIQTIDRSGFFEATYISSDDLKRNEMYRENIERAKQQASFTDYGEYLDSLQMRAIIKPFETMYMERIAQLTNKTNQFNLTTKRFIQAEIEAMTMDRNYITLYGKLEDKFGDNGVVAVTIGEIKGNTCHIILWLMSCRVLKRDMEYAMMDTLIHTCQVRGIKELVGYYFPTAKNAMVKDFYQNMGFELLSDNDGKTSWKYSIPENYENRNKHIEVENDKS